MSDTKFLVVKDDSGNVLGEHDGYKTFMRQLADPEFRAKHNKDMLHVDKNGKPFMRVEIPEE